MSERLNTGLRKMNKGSIGGQSRTATPQRARGLAKASIVPESAEDEPVVPTEWHIAFTTESITQNNSRCGVAITSLGAVNWYKNEGETLPFDNYDIGIKPIFGETRFDTFAHTGLGYTEIWYAREFTVAEGPGGALHLYTYIENIRSVARLPLVAGYATTHVVQDLGGDHGIDYIDSIEQSLTWGEGYGFISTYTGGAGNSSIIRWDRSLEELSTNQDLTTTIIIESSDYDTQFAWVKISRAEPGYIFLGGNTLSPTLGGDVATIWKYTEDGDLVWETPITAAFSGYPLTSWNEDPFQYVNAFCEVEGALLMFLYDDSYLYGSEEEIYDNSWRVFTLDLGGTILTDITNNCTIDGMTLQEWYNLGGDAPSGAGGQLTSHNNRVVYGPLGVTSGDPLAIEGIITFE